MQLLLMQYGVAKLTPAAAAYIPLVVQVVGEHRVPAWLLLFDIAHISTLFQTFLWKVTKGLLPVLSQPCNPLAQAAIDSGLYDWHLCCRSTSDDVTITRVLLTSTSWCS